MANYLLQTLPDFDVKTTIAGMTVSTVVLPIEHYGGMWYETCAFFGQNSEVLDRYATEEAARAGHDMYVSRLEEYVRKNCLPGNFWLTE